MRKFLVALAGFVFLLPPLPLNAFPQNGQSSSDNLSESTAPARTTVDLNVPTLRITTREVLVDLIALDRHNQPVLDLKPDELQVSERAELEKVDSRKKKRKNDPIPRLSVTPITSLSMFDPNNPTSTQHEARTGFRLLASCLVRSTVHYLLAFHPGPDAWTSGFHHIDISTTRPDTKLFYRHQYYVGLAPGAPDRPSVERGQVNRILQQSACYYPVTPLSITLQARLIDSGRTDVFRYLVSVDASSLSFLTMDGDSKGRNLAGIDRRIELDYGTCNFDEDGKPRSYFHAPLDKVLSSADYARALDRGFPHILEFPAPANIALTRVVLRDRATGNLGAADVILPEREHDATMNHEMIGSFGSIVPAPHSFCGDVYEMPEPSDHLPDFGELDPIGSIYTPALNVANQFFSNSSGIPGVTPRTNLFGIDYHASFWVQNPGEYQFRMASDDGAILQIDDRKVIDLDGLHQVNQASAGIYLEAGLHTIHVPYYQGAPVSVALQLSVKPPAASRWTIFDLNDYATPMAPTENERPR